MLITQKMSHNVPFVCDKVIAVSDAANTDYSRDTDRLATPLMQHMDNAMRCLFCCLLEDRRGGRRPLRLDVAERGPAKGFAGLTGLGSPRNKGGHPGRKVLPVDN